MILNTAKEREILYSQDKNSDLVKENLNKLRSEDPDLCNVVEYILEITGLNKDVFLYICDNPFKNKEINFKLMQFLGTAATSEWYKLINKAIYEYEIEQNSLSYCVECIHQAFLAGFTVEKTESILACSRDSVELNRNLKRNMLNDNNNAESRVFSKKILQDVPPTQKKESIFFKGKMPDYDGYMRIPIKVFYSENATTEPFVFGGEVDIWDMMDEVLKKVRRSFLAYQRRIDTLNRILISKDDLLKKLGQNDEVD